MLPCIFASLKFLKTNFTKVCLIPNFIVDSFCCHYTAFKEDCHEVCLEVSFKLQQLLESEFLFSGPRLLIPARLVGLGESSNNGSRYGNGAGMGINIQISNDRPFVVTFTIAGPVPFCTVPAILGCLMRYFFRWSGIRILKLCLKTKIKLNQLCVLLLLAYQIKKLCLPSKT